MRRFSFMMLALAVIIAAGQLLAQSAQSVDKSSTPDAVIRHLYDIVTFPAGVTPDWDTAKSLFIDEAVIVLRVSRSEHKAFSLQGWVDDFVKFIDQANLKDIGFEERIISAKTTVFRDIAQSFVVYQPRVPGTEKERLQGIDFFQLVKRDGQWKIASIVNEVITPDSKLPDFILQ